MNLDIGKEFIYVLAIIIFLPLTIVFISILYEFALPSGLSNVHTAIIGSFMFLGLIWGFSSLKKPVSESVKKGRDGKKYLVTTKDKRDYRFWVYFSALTGLTLINLM